MLAFKKVFFLIFVVILIIVAVVNSVLVYNKYKGKEKIVAKIYNINKVKYEYHVGSGLDRESFIVTDYNVDYSFKYNGDVKTDIVFIIPIEANDTFSQYFIAILFGTSSPNINVK